MKRQGMDKDEYRQLWIVRIGEMTESGLTQQKWCSQQDIPISTLRYWINRLRKESKSEKWVALSTSVVPVIHETADKESKISIGYGGYTAEFDASVSTERIYGMLSILKNL